MKFLYVLMRNDYPVAVYESFEAAEAMRRERHEPDMGRFWHIATVPLVEK